MGKTKLLYLLSLMIVTDEELKITAMLGTESQNPPLLEKDADQIPFKKKKK